MTSMINLPFSRYPAQLEIVFSERCNHRCDYCWVDKSCFKVLKFSDIQKAVDIFIDIPVLEQTITFTTCEPFIFPDLYKKTVNYIYKQSRNKKMTLVTTTNGLNFNKDMRRFVFDKMRAHDAFTLNISLDGRKDSHDAHRKLSRDSRASAFDLSWKNFKDLPREKVRLISTITPSEVPYFRENIDFILSNGFTKFDIFPQVFMLWPQALLNEFKEKLESFIGCINKESVTVEDLRVLNRLWCGTHYGKLLFGCDAKFYLFEWAQCLPYEARKEYIIGDIKKGVNLEKRLKLFSGLFSKGIMKTDAACLSCEQKHMCFFPLPLFMWCGYHKKDFKPYFNNFCRLAKIFINLSRQIKEDKRNDVDAQKLCLDKRNKEIKKGR